MNTKEYCRPEVKVFVFTTEGGFATITSSYESNVEGQYDLESPEFEEW